MTLAIPWHIFSMDSAVIGKTGCAEKMAEQDQDHQAAEDYARLKEFFFRAIELEGERRSRFVEEVCKNDAELRAELESLLQHHQRSDLPPDFESQ